MFSPQDKSRIDGLKDSLYSRKEKASNPHTGAPTAHFEHHEPVSVSDNWKTDESAPLMNKNKYRFRTYARESFIGKLLVFSIFFFTLAVIFALYIFYGGSNEISTDNLAISIVAPISVGAGDTLPLDMLIENKNNVDLEGAELLVEYPQGTRKADSSGADLLRDNIQVGTITRGDIAKKRVQAVLYGEEGQQKNISISVSYRVKGSSATFVKKKEYQIVIASAPVRMTVDSLDEVNSGQDVRFTVTVTSNSSTVMKDLVLKAEYGFGFTYKNATPLPANNTSDTWIIGDLAPSMKRTIVVSGKIEGQDSEERNFRFTLGIQDKRDPKTVGTTLLSQGKPITVKKPFVGIGLVFDGSNANEYSASPGTDVRADISWVNNTPNRITDLIIEAKVSGQVLDRNSVNVTRGFYRSIDNIVVWDKTTIDDFAVVNPSDQGTVSFDLSSLPLSTLVSSGLRNQEITVDISVKGKRLGDSNVPQEIVSTVSKKVKIASSVGLTSRVIRSFGPFKNTGPIPPRAERESTYTIVWDVTNSVNNVSDATVVATIPNYVKWLGMVSPSSESVTFDSANSQITWNAGEIKANTGFGNSPKEVSFQISVLPSLSQVGDSPTIIQETTLSATDRFTNKSLDDVAQSLTTSLSSDPSFGTQDGVVGR